VKELTKIRGHDEQRKYLTRLTTQSLLFVGPEGVGRRQVAWWYAAWVNCSARAQAPCGQCRSCQAIADEGHPDVRLICPDAVTTTGRQTRRPEIRIGQLVPRQGEDDLALTSWLQQRPHFRKRVAVIDSADTMTPEAANAFLKFLEKPPSYATIILIAPSSQAVLPTVASRSTILRFGTVDTSSYAELTSHPGLRLGNIGSLERARRQPEAYHDLQAVVERYCLALQEDLETALETADALEKSWGNLGENPGNTDIADLLRERFRQLPASVYAGVNETLESWEEAMRAYASPVISVQVLTLDLRLLLRGTIRPEGW